MAVTDTCGKSLLRMVPVTAAVVPMVYPVPAARVSETVSSGSIVVSIVGSIVRVAVAEPAAKMIVPVVAV
jgi:hypothetical protein